MDRAVIDAQIYEEAVRILDLCRARKLKITTAESCTGGLVAGALTEVAGSSDVFERGFVTYSNEAKQEMLGVRAEILSAYGAVSAQVAEAMARGALANSDADIAVAITGIAGPGGGSAGKPIGLVHFAAAAKSGGFAASELRYGDAGRAEVRRRSVLQALAMLGEIAGH